MREENRKSPKNKWSQLFKKKWFFPAVYLTVAALLLTAVVWYQNIGNQVPDAKKNQEQNLHDQDAQSVLDQQEVIQMPIADEAQAEIVTKFYDFNADEKDQKDGVILYNNRYYQSTGVSIGAADGEAFDVVASLSGTIKEVKEDPLLGNIVVMQHANDVETYYASLGEVKAKAGDDLKQGDVIGQAGKNLFMKDNGTHVHFELRKAGQELNPEQYFNQPLSKLDAIKSDENTDKDDASNESDTQSEDPNKEMDSNEDAAKDDADTMKEQDTETNTDTTDEKGTESDTTNEKEIDSENDTNEDPSLKQDPASEKTESNA